MRHWRRREEKKVVDELGVEEPEGKEEEPDALIFGKYKTIEEAEKGYKELERDFHAARQPAKEEPEDFGYVAPGLGGQGVPSGEAPDPNEAFYENPAQFILQTIGQARQIDRIAAANRRAALRELGSHPLFGSLRDELEATLDAVDPAYLVDPNQARQVIRAMFGERLVNLTTSRPAGTPTPQKAGVRRTISEIEEPGAAPDEAAADATVDAEGEELLQSLGLSPKSRKAAAESWAKRIREERVRR